jgi:hypothetical protein
MGCVFSFDVRWGSSQSFSWRSLHFYFILFGFLVIFSLDLTSHIVTLLTFLSS